MRILPMVPSLLIALLFGVTHAEIGSGPAPHPHFRKKLEARVAKDVVLTIGYQTASFSAERYAKMKSGQVFHLAGATLGTTAELEIGGQRIAAGDYSMKARLTDDRSWELLLDTDGAFSRNVTDEAAILETAFVGDAEQFGHLSIDVQPTGDKEDTTLFLEIRFDKMRARALIRTDAD